MKQCKKCGKFKPHTEFYESTKSWCKECMRKYSHDKNYYHRSGLKSKMCKVCKDVYPLVDFTVLPNGKHGRVCIHCQGKQEGKQLEMKIPKQAKPKTIKQKPMEQTIKKGAPKVSVLTKILDRLFGRKYYLNIINVVGTGQCEASCFIFPTKEMADRHKDSLRTNLRYQFIETISFRSRIKYGTTYNG